MTSQTLPPPSDLQMKIYEATKDTTKNIAVLATAGSGKTTTLLGILQRASKARRGIFLSFSKSIIEELKERVPSHIQASTLHSQGFSLMRKYFTGIKLIVVEDKYFRNALQLYKESKVDSKFLTKQEYRECKMIESVCAYARMTLTPFSEESLRVMCHYYNIDYTPDVIQYSLKLLSKSLIGKGKAIWIDFVDMIYFPAKTPAMFTYQYDDVYLDEAQDTNNAQRTMIEALLKPKGRLISVGDDFQCIYGFSGADVDSFKKLRERPNTIVLPLSISYRCTKSAVRRAQEICPDIQAHDNAIEGDTREGYWTEIQEGDMVLSRTTKPLITLYFKLIEANIKAQVIGKDIEEGLIALAEDCSSPTKEGVLTKLNLQFDKLVRDLEALGLKRPELTPQYAALEEKHQVIQLILSKIDNASGLVAAIKDIFHEDKKAARLMTIHRSKGLECERVFIIDRVKGEQMMPSKRATQQWEHIQERNLIFVASTRNKKDLIFLHIDD